MVEPLLVSSMGIAGQGCQSTTLACKDPFCWLSRRFSKQPMGSMIDDIAHTDSDCRCSALIHLSYTGYRGRSDKSLLLSHSHPPCHRLRRPGHRAATGGSWLAVGGRSHAPAFSDSMGRFTRPKGEGSDRLSLAGSAWLAARSVTSRRRSMNRRIIALTTVKAWWLDSTPELSGEPGAIQVAEYYNVGQPAWRLVWLKAIML